MTLARDLLLGAAIATWLSATNGTDFEPDGVQAVVAAADVLGLVILGYVGGWRALLLFALAYTVVAAIHTEYFWTDDPTRSGLDDMDPLAGVFFVLPFALLLIAVGAIARTVTRRQVG